MIVVLFMAGYLSVHLQTTQLLPSPVRVFHRHRQDHLQQLSNENQVL